MTQQTERGMETQTKRHDLMLLLLLQLSASTSIPCDAMHSIAYCMPRFFCLHSHTYTQRDINLFFIVFITTTIVIVAICHVAVCHYYRILLFISCHRAVCLCDAPFFFSHTPALIFDAFFPTCFRCIIFDNKSEQSFVE